MIPRLRLAHLPTPVEALPRLSAHLSGPRLYVKRDDQTGVALGGNKVRKLEFVLAEAQNNGARTLITAGAAQSNHCRQTAALAARLGLKCILVLFGEPDADVNGNLLLDRLFGAQIEWTTREQRDATMQAVFDRCWEAGQRPYLIPTGASMPTGTLGYAYAFDELMAQGVNPDWIVLASSSGGTHAGLVLGARRAGWQGKILGISIDRAEAELQTLVSSLATQASERFGPRLDIPPDDILVNDRYLGGGYGVLGDAEVEAILLFAEQEGLLLDPVYTGRAAAGLIDLIRKETFRPDESVLFWHTGGTPALFADGYSDKFVN
jgi:D-cysteine desulfhydrase family pyridoxal phosphate-dependent enzyme